MRFSEVYSKRRPALSLEFFPPKDPAKLPETKSLIERLAGCAPAFMTVTYGAGGSTRALTEDLVRFIRTELKLQAVQHVTCVGHSKAEIDRVLQKIEEDGVSHVLALRGDPPHGTAAFAAHPDGFDCARDLTKHITATTNLSIAVAGYPEVHKDAKSRNDDLKYLLEKVQAGAEVVFTQLFFSNELYFRFVDDARKIGIEVPIVPGIMPIGNVGQLKRFTGLCGASLPSTLLDRLHAIEADPESVTRFGTDYALRQCEELLEGGAPGIHLYTLNRSVQVEPIVAGLKGLLACEHQLN